MNAGYFIVIVLVSGFIAGTIHGAVNLAIVEPYLDEAIGIENQNLFNLGRLKTLLSFGLNTIHTVIGKKAVSC